MNDLISRSKLKEALMECLDDDKIQEALNFFGIYDFINNAPTAYNVKNVVEQIEKQIKWYDEYEDICLKRGDEKEAHTFSCLSDGLHQALEFVRNGGNADVSEINVGNNGWIPVNKKLPDVGITVLCYWKKVNRYDNSTEFYYTLMHRNADVEWISEFGRCAGEVLAWQPLVPYIGENNGNI